MFAIALFFAHLVAIVAGATTNRFVSPGPQDFDHSHIDGTYPIGSTINLRWETTFEAVTVVIWQDGPLTFQYLPNSLGLVNSTSFTWTVNLSGTGGNPNFNLSAGGTFFFGVFQTGTPNVFESQYINITSNAVASSPPTSTAIQTSTATQTPTASGTTSTSPSSSISVSSTSTSASSTSTPPPSSSQVAQGGMSTTAKTGLGVGLGVGVVALAAGLGAGYLLSRRKKDLAVGVPATAEYPPYVADAKQVLQAPVELPPGQVSPVELPPQVVQPRIYEL